MKPGKISITEIEGDYIPMWSNGLPLLIHLEPSTRCNAACPFCPRYVNGTPNLLPGFVQRDVTIEEYKQWLTPETLAKSARVMLCGNYGDPLAAPDIADIVEYTLAHIPKHAYFVLNTNGGLGNSQTWIRLAAAVRDHGNANIIFSIDGLEDTNHIYRRNVRWDILEANIRLYTKHGGRGSWDYLVFEHNRHQQQQAMNVCTDFGLTGIRFKEPYGLEGGTRGVYNSEGKLEYTISNVDVYPTFPELTVDTEQVKSQENTNITPVVNPQCKSLQTWGNEIMIQSNGQVLPCCYIGDHIQSQRPGLELDQLTQAFDQTQLNLNANSLENIVNTIESTLLHHWQQPSYDAGNLKFCSRMCCE